MFLVNSSLHFSMKNIVLLRSGLGCSTSFKEINVNTNLFNKVFYFDVQKYLILEEKKSGFFRRFWLTWIEKAEWISLWKSEIGSSMGIVPQSMTSELEKHEHPQSWLENKLQELRGGRAEQVFKWNSLNYATVNVLPHRLKMLIS